MQQIHTRPGSVMVRNPRLVEDTTASAFYPKNYEWVG
jgi:hypothetical protein